MLVNTRHDTEDLGRLFDQMPVAFCLLDTNFCYLACSPAWREQQQLDGTDIDGESIFGLTHRFPFEEFCPQYFERALSGQPQGGEFSRFETSDGQVEYINWTVQPYQPNESEQVAGIFVFVDIVTRLRDLEEALVGERARRVESARLAALGQMAGGIAHEINNPLTAVYALVEEIEEALTEGCPACNEVSRTVGELESAVSRIVSIVSGLRSLARDGSTDPFAPHDLRNILRETLRVCGERFRHEQIELRVSEPAEPAEPALVTCQPVQLSQVILNLINNAYDATIGLGERWIAIEITSTSDCHQLTIADNGHGIPPAIRDKILDPFFTTKEVGAGTGLGLSIAHEIIKKHQGELTVDGASKYTQFIISLPAAQTS